MAERRMFAKTIIDSDAFLDMPLSAQALYFHLSMRADDDGFVNNPKKIQRIINAGDDDLKILLAKSFLIPFDSGIVVIKHWKIHNYIQKDRYKETVYLEEKSLLSTKENNAYTLDTECIQNVSKVDTQYSIGKVSIDKDSIIEDNIPIKESKHKHGEYGHVLLKDNELDKLNTEYGRVLTNECITFLDEYIEMKGYKAKSHYLCIKKWVIDAVKKKHPNAPADKLDESYNMMAEWARGK